MVFDKQWFEKHQRLILFFANTVFGRKFFGVEAQNRIVCISPNAVTFDYDGKALTTEVRTHNKYSKRLYHGLKPLWELFHSWDTSFANTLKPAWNIGFDSFTQFPDASTGGTTVDGDLKQVELAGTTFTAIRGGSGTDHTDTLTTFRLFMSTTGAGTFDNLWRAVALFDTSSVGAGAAVGTLMFSFCSSSTTDTFTDSVMWASASPASNNDLVNADYALANFGTTGFGSVAVSAINTSGTTYNDITANAAGRANINVTGISEFGLMLKRDFDNNPPTGGVGQNENVTFIAADTAGTATDPKITVTYLPPINVSLDSTDLNNWTQGVKIS